MRRTDEAFKKEVLRRYGVQAKNRRNLRILALSPLIFCVFIAGVLLLPTILGMFESTPIADDPAETTTIKEEFKETLPEDHPLAKYLNRPVEEVRCHGGEYYTWHTCTENEVAEILTRILELSISETDTPDFSSGQSMPRLSFKFTDTSTVQLFFDPSGSIQLLHYPGDGTLRTILGYYQIPADEMAEFASYLRMISSKNEYPTLDEILASFTVNTVRVSGYQHSAYIGFDNSLPEAAIVMQRLKELDLTMPGISSLNWLPETTVRLILDQYSMNVSVDPHTGWLEAKLFSIDDTVLATSYYRVTPAKAKALVICVEELLYGKSSLNNTSETDPDQAFANYLSGTIDSMGLCSFSVQSHTHGCSVEEMEQIVAELMKLTKSKSDPVVQRPSGAVVYFTVEDTRIILTFDPSGYMEMRCFSSDYEQTILFQGYAVPADEVAEFSAIVEEIMYCTPPPEPVEPVYPTPANLCTDLYPTADYMRLYPEYLSSYDSVFDSATINEMMQMLHGLQLTETSTTPEYVFNQPIVNLWFTGYDYYVMLDDQGGWVRTFLYANDEATLLESKLYRGSPAEIAVITDYLENRNRNSWVDSLQLASLDTFRSFMKQSAASVELAPYSHFSLSFQSTDTKVITTVINEILSMNLIDQKEGFSADYYNDSPYVNIRFANGSSASLFFNTSGYVEYRLRDQVSNIDYAGRYRLPAAEVKAFAEFIDPYLKAEPSDEAPRIEDLTDNAALQSFLAGVGVTVKGAPEDAPLEIQRILNNYDNTAHFFAYELSYTSPDGIVLEYLLYDYSGIDRSPLTDEERLGLVKAGVHPEMLNLDFSRYTFDEIYSMLEDTLAYMPAFADKLHEELLKCTVYVPETGYYYQIHSDALGYIVGVNACMYQTNRADTVIVLFEDYFYGGLQIAAFRIVDGEYRLYGYTPI